MTRKDRAEAFMGKRRERVLVAKNIVIALTLWLGLLGAGQAVAGGILLYEVGTRDVGLGSAGWGARAQDASTILTNPAGMTRLEGTQFMLGAQALYGDYGFSIGQGSSPGLGVGDGGNLAGSYKDAGILFLAVHFNWVF